MNKEKLIEKYKKFTDKQVNLTPREIGLFKSFLLESINETVAEARKEKDPMVEAVLHKNFPKYLIAARKKDEQEIRDYEYQRGREEERVKFEERIKIPDGKMLESPCGVSAWKNYGAKYGYDTFFEGKVMTTKEELKFIIKLIKKLESNKGFGKSCKNFCIDCGGCKGQLLIAMLQWYQELIN